MHWSNGINNIINHNNDSNYFYVIINYYCYNYNSFTSIKLSIYDGLK